MFRRKKGEPTQREKLQEAIEYLSEMEPRQMDRLISLAKERRSWAQKIDAFVGVSTIAKSKDIDFEEAE